VLAPTCLGSSLPSSGSLLDPPELLENTNGPISLLTSFSKTFEKLIFNRLYNHFETNSILLQEQFGFSMQHSTEQAAFSLINSILTALTLLMLS
jgi:hypothetical protein